MHQDDIPSHLHAHFGAPKSPFFLHQGPFTHILFRALAVILAQGKDPASQAIAQRFSLLDGGKTEGTSPSVANSAANTQEDPSHNPQGASCYIHPEDDQLAAKVAADLLNTPAFFTGLGKRPAFACSQLLQAVTNDSLSLPDLAECSAETVIESLLAVRGLGPDTVEALVLYAFDIPFIPVNAALYRIAHRHEKIPEVAEREEIRDWYFSFFPDEVSAIRQTHSHLLAVGRQFCTSSKTLCASCPLKDML